MPCSCCLGDVLLLLLGLLRRTIAAVQASMHMPPRHIQPVPCLSPPSPHHLPLPCPAHPLRFLEPDYRRPLVVSELLGFRADIMCLQEVDEKAFTAFLAPQLAQEGERCPDRLLCTRGGYSAMPGS